MTLGLFPFQREIVEWALDRERCAIFADTGLGKAAMQLRWASATQRNIGGKVLILAPLATADRVVIDNVQLSLLAEGAA